MTTVFYDQKCGLCLNQIDHYLKVAPLNILNWQDITESAWRLNKESIFLCEALRLMHTKDEEGLVYVGLDAFIFIWRQLRIWSVLNFLVSLPIIQQITNTAYLNFSNWRFKKLGYFQLIERQEKK